MRDYKRPSREERKALFAKILQDCTALADRYIKEWKPIDPNWETVEGACYLRLSTEWQVLVERGSLEQQINSGFSEAEDRSRREKINYRITKFYIEPARTGTNDDRTQFQLLRANIRRNRHRFIIFKEITRLLRETTLWKEFFQLCIQNKCEIFIEISPLIRMIRPKFFNWTSLLRLLPMSLG